MPVMREYPPGTPCWADLTTSEPAASLGFYTGLFGWASYAAPDDGGASYTFFAPAGTAPENFPGRVVAALMPSPGPERPAVWNTYVSVADIGATAALVTGAGGGVVVPPLDVAGQGQMAMFADDQEALFAAWQPVAFPGCGLVNEPGCFCWSELACRDTEAAARFYGRGVGWGGERSAAWCTWTKTGRSRSRRAGSCTSP